MAIRQYVGARYVPRFTGLYDATQIYDALDVVDNGSGTSYIAKKTVPAGTPLTDTEYWFVYGATSGAILDLQNRMTNAENDITALDDKVDKLGNLNMLKGHLVFIGDSYITAVNPSWADYMAGWLGKTLGVSYFVNAKGGTGFAAFADGKNFTSLLNEIVVTDPDLVTCVIVQGGANDIYNANRPQIRPNMGLFRDAVKTRFKNASIVVGECEAWLDSTYDAYVRDDLFYQYQLGSAQIGAYFMGATGTGLKLDPANGLQSDLKHPTAYGMTNLAVHSMAALLGVNFNYPMNSYNGTYYYKESAQDMISGYFTGNFNYAPSPALSSFTCDGANSIDVPVTNHNLRAANYPVETNGFVQLRSTDNHYYMMPCTYVPTVNGLKIYPRCMNDNNTNFLTLDINQVTLPRIKFDIIGHCIG